MLTLVKKALLNPFVLLALAFVVALHQYLNWGTWFEFQDIHHEAFIIALVFCAFCLIILRGRL